MFKVILSRVYTSSRILLRTYRPNTFYRVPRANIYTKEPVHGDGKPFFFSPPSRAEGKGIQYRYDYARRLFVDNVLKRTTNSLAADLRRRSAKQLFNGNPSPFFALVGVSLASGTGMINREDDFEGVCLEIRESLYRMRKNLVEAETYELEDELSLNSLEFGSVIAKGCNAVVYEAREKSKTIKIAATGSEEKPHENKQNDYPLAVKMMFNFDAESNATSILRSMYREMVPLQNITIHPNMVNFWEHEMAQRLQRLPPHVNIVSMYRSFTDFIPELPDCKNLYPHALPTRINPDGYGRNMSLFLVMKKYNTSLRQYLIDKAPDIRDAILLFTQLLEAAVHMNYYEVAHRDLKSDNILLDTTDGEENCPTLAVTDFGCCLSDRHYGLQMPYKTPDTDKGGNATLMAPEVASAQCGMFASIDYSKSDAWTIGTLAYELFTGRNPFYRPFNETGVALRNTTYTEDMLPELPGEVPYIISQIVKGLLVKNPTKRLDAELAATICQMYLWAPSQWLSKSEMPSNSEILQWLLSLTTKVLYEGPLHYRNRHPQRKRRSTAEYQLIATFLGRVRLGVVQKALNWILNA